MQISDVIKLGNNISYYSSKLLRS